MSRPWASVVLPTRDRAHLLPRAVASVLAQSDPDWELLVVDDGSTDETAEVLRAFDDPRIRVLARQAPGGVAAARNLALSRAEGEVVCFLDDDDEYLPGFLEQTRRAFAEQPRAGFSWCGAEVVADHQEGRVTRRSGVWQPRVSSRDQAYRLFLAKRMQGTGGLAVRRETLVKLGGFDERFRRAEDTDLLIRLAREHAFVVVPQILLRIHEHPGPRLTVYGAEMAEAYELLIDKNRDALHEDPDLWFSLHYKAGWLYYHSGRRQRGRRCLRRALEPGFRLRGWLALLFFETLGNRAPALHRMLARWRRRL